MCVGKESESIKQPNTAMREKEKKKNKEEIIRYVVLSCPANDQLGCSSSASSSIPHYYCDYRARSLLL